VIVHSFLIFNILRYTHFLLVVRREIFIENENEMKVVKGLAEIKMLDRRVKFLPQEC